MSIKHIMLALSAVALVASASARPAVIDTDAAIRAWKVKPKAKETTSAMVARVRSDVAKLTSGDKSKITEGAKWKLVDYFFQVPWKNISPEWRAWYLSEMPNKRLSAEQRDFYTSEILKKQIFEMTPKEVDVLLGYAQQQYPNLRDRIMFLAHKNIGQKYNIYLLGEFPYEIYDDQPLYCLPQSDCVVFAEHTYAMALAHDWAEFFKNLQRIRYKNGEIGMLTRNHYTEADWDKNNSWLVTDATNDLNATTTTKYKERIDRAGFFKKLGIGEGIPVQHFEDSYIPAEAVEGVLGGLKDGDFVNVARGSGSGDGAYIGHVGLIGHTKDGKVTFIHSTPPKVKEQPIMEYVAENLKKNPDRLKKGEPVFYGFKFLRLNADELAKTGVPAPTPKQ